MILSKTIFAVLFGTLFIPPAFSVRVVKAVMGATNPVLHGGGGYTPVLTCGISNPPGSTDQNITLRVYSFASGYGMDSVSPATLAPGFPKTFSLPGGTGYPFKLPPRAHLLEIEVAEEKGAILADCDGYFYDPSKIYPAKMQINNGRPF